MAYVTVMRTYTWRHRHL